MTQPCIIFDNVSFSYSEQGPLVLRNVSLDVSTGEFLGVIGPNGGGKTTLLKLLMGFLEPTAGQIQVLGMNPVEAREHMAYVPQVMRFDKEFPISVLELVLAGRLSHLPWYGIYRKADKKAALEALERVGLQEFVNAPFGTLSGGQAQRALIARALVTDPQILLLDEPTASVDVNAEADICSLLKQLQGKMTILMVTHDIGAVIRDVGRVLCVQGEAYTFKPQEVCEHFALGLYHAPLIQMSGQKDHFNFIKLGSKEK